MGPLPLLLLLLDLAVAHQQQDSVARDIAQGLGLARLPDITKANISQAEWSRMTELYLQRVAARRLETEAGETSGVQLYVFSSAAGPADSAGEGSSGRVRRAAGRRRSARTRLRMQLPADTEVDEAEVRVLAQGNLRLFEVWRGGRRLIAQHNLTTPGWKQMDVLSSARRAAQAGQPLLLELRCSAACQDANLNVLAQPAQHVQHVRAKRAALRSECGKDGQRCCRHALEVEFAQIPDMEFIMQPKRFDAGFCRGRCPPRYHPAHHHALIQGLLRRRGAAGAGRGAAGRRVPRPCCAPARLQPLDVLYVDEDDPTKLKLSEWSEMRVVDCACA